MPAIRNSELLKKFTDFLQLKTNDFLESEAGRMLVPVINFPVPVEQLQAVSATQSDGTSQTFFTAASDKRTFIVGIGMSVSKDANSPSINSRISGTLLGAGVGQRNLMSINYEPLTAGNFFEYIFFPRPIEMPKAGTMRQVNSSATASIDSTGFVYFFEVDD